MSGFPTVQLGEVTTKVGSGSTPRGGEAAYKSTGTPLIRSMNVHFGGFREDGLAHIDDDQASALRNVEVRARDVLLNITGASIGRVTIAPPHMDGARVNQHVCIIRPDDRLEPSFLRWFLASPHQQRLINSMESGATRQALTKEKILAFEVPLPSLDGQREIVAELEKQFSRLDEAVANLQRVKANLKRYKASVLKAAVEGRLVETEATLARREGRTYETGEQLLQRILAERRAKWAGKGKYKEATPSVDTEGLHVPEGWVVGSAEQVCSSVRDGTHDTPDYVAIGVPLITSKNLDENGIDFENVKFISERDHVEISKRSGVSGGDILFAMIGTIGNPCEVKTDARFSIKNVALFKANSECLNPTYFCYWLQSAPLNKWLEPRLKGTTQKFAPLGLLRELAAVLPPFVEQARIVAEVHRHLSIIREVESEVDASLHRAQALRQSTLAKAFSSSSPEHRN